MTRVSVIELSPSPRRSVAILVMRMVKSSIDSPGLKEID